MAKILGTSGNDQLIGTSADDSIYADDGNDTVKAGAGNDLIYGGDGNDQLYGEDGNDTIDAGNGNDTVDGGGGDDTISAGDGNDTVYGGAGNDVIDGAKGNDTIYGGDGDDRILASLDSDAIYGGGGIDTYDASGSTVGININLATGVVKAPSTSTISGVENVTGSRFADVIVGDAGANVFNGNGGNDLIYGGGGNDTFIASNGNVSYTGGAGNDTFIFTVGTTGAQYFDGQTGNDAFRIVMTSAQLTTAVTTELNAYATFSANPLNAGKLFQFSAIGNIKIAGTDNVTLVIDGKATTISSVVNHAPAISPGTPTSLSVGHNNSISGSVSATDADGDKLSYSVLTQAGHGSVTIDASTGKYVYAAGDYMGADSFTVRVSDGRGGFTDHTVQVNLTNTGPVVSAGSNTSVSVAHGASVSGAIAATDANNDKLSFAIQAQGQHGTVTLDSATGKYVYTGGDYVGSDSFTVRVADGHGGFADQTVTVGLTNAGPTISAASDKALSVGHTGVVGGSVIASDAEGDKLTYSVLGNGAHGSVSIDAATGKYVYAAGDYVGSDSFTVRVADGHGGFADHTVQVGLTNTGPVVSAGSDAVLTVAHGASVSGKVAATDANNDKLSFEVQIQGQHGTVTLDSATGKYVYAAGDYVGSDTFTIRVSDGHGGFADQTVTVGLTNTGPAVSAVSDNFLSIGHTGTVAGTVLASDAEGDKLTYSVLADGTHGTVIIDGATGHYTYAAADYVGTDGFTIRVSDGHGGFANHSVQVNVTNTWPYVLSSSDTTLSVAHGATVQGAVAGADADHDPLSYAVQSDGAHGHVTIDAATGKYLYAAGDYIGMDTFTIRASDGHGGFADHTVSVGITNSGPVVSAVSDAFLSVAHTDTITGAVLATDAEGDHLTYALLADGQHGAVSLDAATGHYTYAAGDYVGIDGFTIRVSDGHGGFADHSVQVNVTNTWPYVLASSESSLTVGHGKSIQGAVVAADGEHDPLSFSVKSDGAHGHVTVDAATGKYVYAAGDYVGTDTFTIRVSDGHGGYADHAVSVGLTNANPVVSAASDAALAIGHGKSIVGHISATDADGDGYSFSISTGPQHGTLVFTDANGSYVYKADDYVGWDSFTMRVTDGHGGFADHVVTVNDTNLAPVIDQAASTSSFTTLYGTAVSGTVVASDGDGDGLTFTLKSGPAHGSVQVDANGHFTVNTVDAAGTDSFVVTASDGHGGSANHTVNFGVIGTLDTSSAAAAVNVNLTTGAAAGVDQSKLAWAINVLGSAFNDLIYGDARDNILDGGTGKDEVHGAAGNDTIGGGLGDDKLFGEDGNDKLSGGDGADMLNGGGGNDAMNGGTGNDGFFGGGGNDTISGGDGDDKIYGDGGNDIISGGRGNDILTGGSIGSTSASTTKGANTYAWLRADVLNADGSKAGFDHITDFGSGDRIDFTGLVPAHPAAVHDAVRVTDTVSGLVVSVDMGGAAGFVDVVVLDNVHGLTVDDLAHNGAITI